MAASVAPALPAVGGTRGAEQAARRALRRQIVRLGGELDDQRCSHWPRPVRAQELPGRVLASEPRLLSLGELELLRDDLVRALADERRAAGQRTLAEEQARRLREELLLDPAAHPGVRVTQADAGEPGCGGVRCEPGLGLLGMLMGWWRVVISSGCP